MYLYQNLDSVDENTDDGLTYDYLGNILSI